MSEQQKNSYPTHVADLDGGLPRCVPAVNHDGAPGGLVDLGQKVEHRGLPRAVGADEARDLRAANGHVEVVHTKYSALSGILRLPSYWRKEREAHERALELLSIFDMQDMASPAVSRPSIMTVPRVGW